MRLPRATSEDQREEGHDQADGTDRGEDDPDGPQDPAQMRRLTDPDAGRVVRAVEPVEPSIGGGRGLAAAQRSLVEVAGREPASGAAAVPIDHGDLDGDPLPLDEPDQQGHDEERHADTEADPGQHLADDGEGVDELHESIVETHASGVVRDAAPDHGGPLADPPSYCILPTDSLTGMTDSADIPTSRPMDAWLDALSQPTGSPGGGAASGVMLGLAAALMGMVAGYTREDPAVAESTGRLDPVRAELLQAVEADGVVSAGFGAALALAPEDPAREERVRNAALDAAASVARLGRIGITLVAEARTLASRGNPHLAVDLAVATEALEAGLSGASLNLRANLQLARAHGASPSMRSGLDEEVGRLAEARTQVSRITAELSARLD